MENINGRNKSQILLSIGGHTKAARLALFCESVRQYGLFLFLLAFLFSPSPACAYPFTDEQAVRAIIGEAENQGYIGMLAVGEAIRNRGTLKGVYGLNSPRLKKAPEWVWRMARKAWKESQHSNITKGANHWHNVDREGETYWTKKYHKTVKIGNHQFYRGKV